MRATVNVVPLLVPVGVIEKHAAWFTSKEQSTIATPLT